MPVTKTVLAIEDSYVIQVQLKKLLEHLGGAYTVTVVSAFDGERGIEICKTQQIDLIILDVAMPKVNGIQFLTNRRESPKLKTIPVIVLSNLKSDEIVNQAKDLGARSFLSKPIDLAELRLAVVTEFDRAV